MRSGSSRFLAAFILWAIASIVSVTGQIEAGRKAEVSEAIGRAWRGPNAEAMGRILSPKSENRTAAVKRSTRPPVSSSGSSVVRRNPPISRPTPPMPEDVEAELTFRPSLNSGVKDNLVAAISPRPADKKSVTELFQDIEQQYASEAFIDGRSNNIAAAMTYFIIRMTVVYDQGEIPPKAISNRLFTSLTNSMQKSPEIAGMSDLERQRMHDWLVYTGGFVYAGYADAKRTNNAESLANFRAIALRSAKTIGFDLADAAVTADGLKSKRSN